VSLNFSVTLMQRNLNAPRPLSYLSPKGWNGLTLDIGLSLTTGTDLLMWSIHMSM